MPIDITMPALSPTMETGTLAKWLVKVGDPVKSGDILCEIETDKATMEVESIDEGTVAELLVADGTEDIKVGAVIARLSGEGEAAAPKAETPAPAPLPAQPAAESPTPPRGDGAQPAPALRLSSGERATRTAAPRGGKRGRPLQPTPHLPLHRRHQPRRHTPPLTPPESMPARSPAALPPPPTST